MADAVAAPSVATPSAVLPNLDCIIRGLLYVYIFSLPFKRLLFIERNGFIILVVLLVLWCAVNRQHFFLRTPIDVPLLAFIAWVGFTVPFATFPLYSSKEFAKLLQQGLMFYTVMFFFRDSVHRWRLVWMLIAQLALVSAYGMWEFMSDHGTSIYYIESFLPGDAALATYLLMLIPLSAAVALYLPSGKFRNLTAGATGLSILCLFLTYSRAGILAMMAETLAVVWLVRQRRVAFIAGVVIFSLLIGAAGLLILTKLTSEGSPMMPGSGKFTTYNLEARLNIWLFALKKLEESPIVGIGFGKDNFFLVTGTESSRLSSAATTVMPAGTHNTFLDVAVGAGIPALLALIWLLWAIMKEALHQLRLTEDSLIPMLSLALAAMVVGMCVRNFFDHMWVSILAVQFWVLVGLAVFPRSKPLGPSGL